MRENKLIQLYITNMCNSHCKTCSIWKNEYKDRQELSIIDISKITALFPEADYVIGGGEAILHKDIDCILCILRDRHINYTLLSNCILSDKLERVVKENNVPAVTISCDGINHDTIRGSSGNLMRICNFKKWCDLNNVNMKISYTYSKFNEKSFKEDMKFFKETLGLSEIYFCIAQDMDLLKTTEADENFVANDFKQILGCDMITDKDKNHIRRMITGERWVCISQSNVHTIYSNGDIVRCQSFKSRDILGNIHELSPSKIRNILSFVENKECEFDSECNLLCQRRYD